MLKDIPIKNITELSELMPKNYHKTFEFIKEYLMKYNIDLDSNL